MSPFRSKDAFTWKARVRGRDGVKRIKSLGTTVRSEADMIEAWCEGRYKSRDWRVIEAMDAKKISPARAYFAAQESRLDAVLDEVDAEAAINDETDLDPLVKQWAKVARSPVYVRQVRAMIPEGKRFGISQYTRKMISTFLASLDVAGPTRNRYRVAFSQFARWLIEQEHLHTNPVRDVRGYPENDPRMVHYDRPQAKAIIRRLPKPYNALEAFMCGGAIEDAAARGLRRRDVDLTTRRVKAFGSKTRWRKREVKITEPWCWAIIEAHVRQFSDPEVELFAGITETMALGQHRKAVKAAKLEESTNHDWRHTYAIQALKDGIAPQTVKRQLGHSPHSTVLERVYAAWIPASDADYEPRNATKSATSRPKRRTKTEADA